MPLRPGDSFDRYVIEDVLGQGGMGVVYRARDPKLHRSVALKVLAPRGEGEDARETTSEGAARLLREARAAAALDHPNAVAIFDVGEVDGTPFLAMELVEGASLRARIGDAGATLAQSVGWLVEVARALHAAHERGLVHRDVKPENVMVRRDGVAMVLDFGIARSARGQETPPSGDAPTALPTITGEGIVVGTPLYMAPEQLRGERLDGRADQFAWGVTAYELLSGKLPWGETRDGMALVAAITSKDPPPLDRIAPAVPPAVARVVERALAKDPKARFESMRAAADALAAAAESARTDPALAPTETARKAGAAPQRRPSRGQWVVLAGITLAAGAGAFALAPRDRTRAPAASAAPATSAAAGPLACRDAPAPESKVPAAMAAYRAGIQAGCDADALLAQKDMERAVTLDPSLAPAHVHLAMLRLGRGDVEPARRELQTAMQLRSSMSAHDLDLLSAFEPIVARTPPDWREAIRHLDAAIGRSPLDSWLWMMRGYDYLAVNDYDAAIADERRAAELDPSAAFPWRVLADTYAQTRSFDEQRRALDRCLQVVPTAAGCVQARLWTRVREGDCEGMASDAEAMLGMSPDDQTGLRLRTDALAWRGASREAIRSSLDPWVQQATESTREARKHAAELKLALWSGDFAGAEAAADARERTMTETDVKSRSEVAWRRVQARLESGRLRDAGAAAADYLKTGELWAQTSMDSGVYGDWTPLLLAVARDAGTLTQQEWASRRDAWIRRWTNASPGKDDARAVLVAAYMLPVQTRAEAEEAMARLPELLPLTPEWWPNGDVILGLVYALAGRTEEALPYLRRAARACWGFEMVVDVTRASLMLGDALAAKGDRAGACAAYKDVLDRWGAAKPRSVSAEAARRASNKLHCGR